MQLLRSSETLFHTWHVLAKPLRSRLQPACGVEIRSHRVILGLPGGRTERALPEIAVQESKPRRVTCHHIQEEGTARWTFARL